jgi:membrane fusion protein, multidrug efflux system
MFLSPGLLLGRSLPTRAGNATGGLPAVSRQPVAMRKMVTVRYAFHVVGSRLVRTVRDAKLCAIAATRLHLGGVMMTIKRSLGLLIPAVFSVGLLGWHLLGSDAAAAADPAAPPDVPVTTAPSQIQDVPEYLDGLGTVQALNVVQIKSQANGTLVALPIAEGEEVHQGDIVAEIDPRPYKAALDQATAQRDEDVALLQSAKLDLQRFENLAKTNFAPIQQVDDQRATVNKEIAAVALDSAMMETAQINLDYCVIRAPIDGRLSFRQIDVGNVIQTANQTSGIISITQDKPITVVFTLPEADLIRIQEARAKGTVPVVAFNSQNRKQILATGTLLTPNNTIDTTTGTISLKATFDNKDDHLWPGQFVNARVQVGTFQKAVTVPLMAVQHGPEGLFVYVVKPDQTVDQINIQVGYQDEDQAIVTNGLSGGETVVVAGQSRLSPSVHVKATDVSKSGQTPPSQASSGSASPT